MAVGRIRGACNGSCVDADICLVLVPHLFLPPSLPTPSLRPYTPTHHTVNKPSFCMTRTS